MQVYKIFVNRQGAYYIEVVKDDGTKRRVAETQKRYQEWLAAGNTPIEVPYVEIPLVDYKDNATSQVSGMAFSKREVLIPTYKLSNANQKRSTGETIYPQTMIDRYFDTVEAFRDEFYRLRDGINAAADYDAVDTVVASNNYPTVISL